MRSLIAILVGLALAVLPVTFGHAAARSPVGANCPHAAAAPMDHARHGGKPAAPVDRGHPLLCCFFTCAVPALAAPEAPPLFFSDLAVTWASDQRVVANIVEPAVPPPRA